MKARRVLTAIAAVTAAVISTPTSATYFGCVIGNQVALVWDDGRFIVNIQGTNQTGYFALCSLASSTSAPGASVPNISMETCRAWYNIVLTAKALNKTVSIGFETANTRAGSPVGATSCDTVIANQSWVYANPAPYALQVNY